MRTFEAFGIVRLQKSLTLEEGEPFMKKTLSAGLLALMGVLVLFSGCASKKQKKEIISLQNQVGSLNNELTRLDEALQETRAAIQSEQNRVAELEGQLRSSKGRLASLKDEQDVLEGIYRTPSGFELPAKHIQIALKNAGYYKGVMDGKIGPGTRQSIQAFQRDNGMTPDGVVGRQTWTKLKSYM